MKHYINANESRGNKDVQERGFILLSVIVLLFILTLVGVAAMFKTNIETKVSISSVDQAKAFAAAKAGLAWNYANWDGAGSSEKEAIVVAVKAGTASVGIYKESLTPVQMSDVGANVAAIDAYVANNSNITVYDVNDQGALADGVWGVGSLPQVALWAASFEDKTDPEYPYATPNTSSCPTCNIVVYALSHSGNAYSLQREVQGVATHLPSGMAAINNVPNRAYWADLCSGSNGSTTQSTMNPHGVVGEDTPARPDATTNTLEHDWMIEATQAEYVIDPNQENIPSGFAFKSNTGTGLCNGECPEFEVEFPITNSENTSTVAVYDTVPLIAYSGHNSVNNMRVDYATQTRDTAAPNAADMPTNKLPHKLVHDNLLGTSGQLNVMNSGGQVFDLDAIRWGAEQFTCRTNNGGKFCAKANTLKVAVHNGRTVRNNGVSVTGDVNAAPVTGRLTFMEFQYNVANAIPMFGLVRVMYPAVAQTEADGSGICNGTNVQLYQTEDASEKANWSAGVNDYTGSPTVRDADGNLGNKAKLIVYGSLMVDFFADQNADFLFDPASGEYLLSNLDNGESKAEMRVPELINPALPDDSYTTLVSFPGITMGSNASAAVNLASPTGGYFPSSEGMVPSAAGTAQQIDGRMKLMQPVSAVNNASKLFAIGDSVRTSGGIGANTATYFTAYKSRLEYYYNFAVATANHSDPNQWPIAAFPGALSDDFCIGQQDCLASPAGSGPNNKGDKFHLMFPSGYMHGWKVALATLNVNAAEWNGLLDGIDTLAAQASVDSTLANKGSPFNSSFIPMDYRQTPAVAFASLAAKATVLKDTNTNDHLYFYTEADATSGYALLTSKWADIPAFSYSGGFMQIQHETNISGVVYTPGPMSWGSEDDTGNPGTGYFNGAIMSGFGFSRGGEDPGSVGYAVVVFDPQSMDNSNIPTLNYILRRYAWEQLH